MRPRTLTFLAVLALTLQAVPGPARGGPPQAPSPATKRSLSPLADSAWDYAKARHLLCRTGFGGAAGDVGRLQALGLRKAVDCLVDYRCQPDVQLPSPIEISEPKPGPQGRQEDQAQMRRVRDWWFQRLIQTQRPLEEKLVLFWHGHFATEYRTVRNSRAMHEQNQLFREHAAGNFGKLLHAILRDPAMLRYLDNNRNVKGRPNENLAREIMELFAMGVDQGYTEKDIQEGARALTGHTFEPRTGKYRYAARNHDSDPKTIFDQTGNWDGDQFVDLILKQPATTRHIARKLFVFFAHENPDETTIDRLAQVLRDSNYQLAPMLKTLFLSEEFYSKRSIGTQIKSPVQLVVGTLRTLRIPDPDPAFVALAARSMGQDLFEPPNVKGWDGGRSWINTNTLFARDNFPALLVRGGEGRRPDARPKAAAKGDRPALPRPMGKAFDAVAYLEGQNLETPTAVVDYFARVLFTIPLTDAKREELVAFLGTLPPSAQWSDQKPEVNPRLGALLVLMMSLPEYQLN